jgi:hypothetical protein
VSDSDLDPNMSDKQFIGMSNVSDPWIEVFLMTDHSNDTSDVFMALQADSDRTTRRAKTTPQNEIVLRIHTN